MRFPANTININCVKLRPWPSSPPDHILAEKKVSPSMTTNVCQKFFRCVCGTACKEKSVSTFFIMLPPDDWHHLKEQGKKNRSPVKSDKKPVDYLKINDMKTQALSFSHNQSDFLVILTGLM